MSATEIIDDVDGIWISNGLVKWKMDIEQVSLAIQDIRARLYVLELYEKQLQETASNSATVEEKEILRRIVQADMHKYNTREWAEREAKASMKLSEEE
jgi:hypothetical protein